MSCHDLCLSGPRSDGRHRPRVSARDASARRGATGPGRRAGLSRPRRPHPSPCLGQKIRRLGALHCMPSGVCGVAEIISRPATAHGRGTCWRPRSRHGVRVGAALASRHHAPPWRHHIVVAERRKCSERFCARPRARGRTRSMNRRPDRRPSSRPDMHARSVNGHCMYIRT